uniref:Uncharacterized protein n=1 Tax=Cacopsylla melanoneura TaxID=428564 RepID=A0A8D8V7S8_9HEMI
MRVWLCLLGLGIASVSQCDDGNNLDIIDEVLDLRTAYRKYLPDELTDIPDPASDESRSINISAVQIKKNIVGCNTDIPKNSTATRIDWNALSDNDPDMSESGKQWMNKLRYKPQDSYSWEYTSSEMRKFKDTFERRIGIENQTADDVFQDDISDLWDKYMANKTAPPGFPLDYSPRFMNKQYREYSLAYYNMTVPTTLHWLYAPLTGDQGILYEKAVERKRLFKINKKNTTRVEAINRYIDNYLKDKNLNRTKDVVRAFIGLKRKVGKQLNWTIPPYSIDEELQRMKVPDSKEVIEKCLNESNAREEDQSTDLSKMVDTYFKSKELWFKVGEEKKEKETTLGRVTRPKQAATDAPTTTKKHHHHPKEDAKPQHDARHDPDPTPDEIPPLEQTDSSTLGKKVTSARPHAPVKNNKFINHTAVKFLHKHKNKFLIGGIACLVAAKILG